MTTEDDRGVFGWLMCKFFPSWMVRIAFSLSKLLYRPWRCCGNDLPTRILPTNKPGADENTRSENSDVIAQQTNNLSSGMLCGNLRILLSLGVERLSSCYSGHLRHLFAAHNRLSLGLTRRLSSCVFSRRHTLRHKYARIYVRRMHSSNV